MEAGESAAPFKSCISASAADSTPESEEAIGVEPGIGAFQILPTAEKIICTRKILKQKLTTAVLNVIVIFVCDGFSRVLRSCGR